MSLLCRLLLDYFKVILLFDETPVDLILIWVCVSFPLFGLKFPHGHQL